MGIEDCLKRAGREIDWDPSAVLAVVRAARARERLGLVELDWLRRRSRGDKATIRVFHEVTDSDAHTWIEMRWDDGRVTRHEIRAEPYPIGLWASFPGRRAKLTSSDYTVSRPDGRVIYSIALEDLRSEV